MNTDKIIQLAEALERYEREGVFAVWGLGFDLSQWIHTFDDQDRRDDKKHDVLFNGCGSVACIAGWAIALEQQAIPNLKEDPFVKATAILGLPSARASKLFAPECGDADGGYYTATPVEAARVLRHLAKTGEVDWSVFRSEDAA